jgi:secondary thiamine-phosphate synthase enzyme
MAVVTKKIALRTRSEGEMIDITPEVISSLGSTGLRNGLVTIFVQGSTGAVTTIEFEPGLLQDLPEALERIAPREAIYRHEERWHDGNGRSHVRASFLGPDITIPFVEGKLALGTWQQVVFVELDVRSRSRELIIQVIGE